MSTLRVVLDTNVLVSATVFRKKRLGIIWQLWQEERFELLVSRLLLLEIERKLSEFRKQRLLKKTQLKKLLSRIKKYATLVEGVKLESIVRDPKDNMVIATAITGEADYLVTGDKDILALGKNFRGIKILTPAEFISKVGNKETFLVK